MSLAYIIEVEDDVGPSLIHSLRYCIGTLVCMCTVRRRDTYMYVTLKEVNLGNLIPLLLTYKLIQESEACVGIASGDFHIHYGHVG